MGGEPWMYFVPYEPDLQGVLDRLKEREFRAGRYHPAMRQIPFPVDPAGPAPGAKHPSIDAARHASGADGTCSILDMERVASDPRAGSGAFMAEFCAVRPVPPSELRRLYGTEKPTRAAVSSAPDFLDEVGRGCGVYVILYEGDTPAEICFAGYSFD